MYRRLIAIGTILAALLLLTGCNLDAGTPVPTPDLPQVFISQPESGRQVFEGVTVDIQIDAEDSSVGITRIEFYVDSGLVEEYTLPNYAVEPEFSALVNWQANGVGRHVIQAIAYRPGDIASRPAIIELVVIPREGNDNATDEATEESSA